MVLINLEKTSTEGPIKSFVLTSASCRSRIALQLTGEILWAPPNGLTKELVSPVPTGPTRSPIWKTPEESYSRSSHWTLWKRKWIYNLITWKKKKTKNVTINGCLNCSYCHICLVTSACLSKLLLLCPGWSWPSSSPTALLPTIPKPRKASYVVWTHGAGRGMVETPPSFPLSSLPLLPSPPPPSPASMTQKWPGVLKSNKKWT